MKKKVAIDFDGVVHRYSGWNNGRLDLPVTHSKAVIMELQAAGFEVLIYTTREAGVVQHWLEQFNFPALEVTNEKTPYHVLIDDRVILFEGVWQPDIVTKVREFQTYWEKWKHAPTEPTYSIQFTKDQINRLIELSAPAYDLKQYLQAQLATILNK